MTERRPAHETVPDFVERQIREAQARGEFDGLRGAGRPLPDLAKPYDELWWVKRKLRDEQITDLPPALRARRDRDESLVAALDATEETEVRRILAEVNERIREINRTAWYGPPTSVGPLDVEEVVASWRRRRASPTARDGGGAARDRAGHDAAGGGPGVEVTGVHRSGGHDEIGETGGLDPWARRWRRGVSRVARWVVAPGRRRRRRRPAR